MKIRIIFMFLLANGFQAGNLLPSQVEIIVLKFNISIAPAGCLGRVVQTKAKFTWLQVKDNKVHPFNFSDHNFTL